ncbi:LTA synthase family protein [Planctomycetota bacterium]
MTRLGKSVALICVALAIFSLARLGLYLLYRPDFADASLVQLLLAFAHGVRFDVSIVLAVFAAPIVLMNLPAGPFRRPGWFNAWAWVVFALLIPMVLLLACDLVYYSYVRRHIVGEPLQLTQDLDFLPGMMVAYWYGLVAVLLVVAGFGWVFRTFLKRSLLEDRRPYLCFLVLCLALFLGIRGTLSRKAINPVDAYRDHDFALGSLTLNGVFTAAHGCLGGLQRDLNPMAREEAFRELQLWDTRYPLLRAYRDETPTGLNLVIVLLESWDVQWLDSYDGEGYGYTPCFDALVSEGLKFDRFYASSQRSIGAIQALLTGVPCVVGIPELRRGLEHTNTTRVGAIARKHGYQSLFVQSSRRRSYYMDAVAASLGFEHYYGMEDIPLVLDYGAEAARWGWDHDTLQFSLQRMDELGAPFLAFLFTGTTHAPYPDPGERFHKRPHSRRGPGGFINTLSYSDWALGELVREARKKPWFGSTVWLICADHTARANARDLRKDFRIPFVVYAPGIVEPGVDREVRSQLDGLPTIMDFLGFPEPFTAMGESVLKRSSGLAVVKKGGIMGVFADGAYLQHSVGDRLEAFSESGEGAAPLFDTLERHLLAVHRTTHALVRANRWAPP